MILSFSGTPTFELAERFFVKPKPSSRTKRLKYLSLGVLFSKRVKREKISRSLEAFFIIMLYLYLYLPILPEMNLVYYSIASHTIKYYIELNSRIVK